MFACYLWVEDNSSNIICASAKKHQCSALADTLVVLRETSGDLKNF